MKYLILISLCIGFIYLSYKAINDPDSEPSFRECKVLGKVSRSTNRGSDTDFLLIVNCQGISKEIEVSTTTYVKYEKGDTVYFNLSNKDLGIETGTNWSDFLIIYFMIVLLIIFPIFFLLW